MTILIEIGDPPPPPVGAALAAKSPEGTEVTLFHGLPPDLYAVLDEALLQIVGGGYLGPPREVGAELPEDSAPGDIVAVVRRQFHAVIRRFFIARHLILIFFVKPFLPFFHKHFGRSIKRFIKCC